MLKIYLIMTSQTIYEAAHKGDFEYVRSKLEEDANLLLVIDSVGIKCLQILPPYKFHFWVEIFLYNFFSRINVC